MTNQRDAAEAVVCKCCGGNDLSWEAVQSVKPGGPQHNRLNTNDVACLFVLGCNSCSETVRVMRAEEVAANMSALPAASEGEPVARLGTPEVIHEDDCDAMQQPRADCTCVPVRRPAPSDQEKLDDVLPILRAIAATGTVEVMDVANIRAFLNARARQNGAPS